jgi:hypothetical protein
MKTDRCTIWEMAVGRKRKKMSANEMNTKNSLCASASKDASVSADKSVKTITIVKVVKIAKVFELDREMFDEHYEAWSQKKRDFVWKKMVGEVEQGEILMDYDD